MNEGHETHVMFEVENKNQEMLEINMITVELTTEDGNIIILVSYMPMIIDYGSMEMVEIDTYEDL